MFIDNNYDSLIITGSNLQVHLGGPVTGEMWRPEHYADITKTKSIYAGMKRSPRYLQNIYCVYWARYFGLSSGVDKVAAPRREPHVHTLILALHHVPPPASPHLLLLLSQLLCI